MTHCIYVLLLIVWFIAGVRFGREEAISKMKYQKTIDEMEKTRLLTTAPESDRVNQ